MLVRKLDRLEYPVRVIHGFALQYYVSLEQRLKSGEVVKHNAWVTIVGATVEPVIDSNETFIVLILSFKLSLPLCRTQKLHVFSEISEVGRRSATSNTDCRKIRNLGIFRER